MAERSSDKSTQAGRAVCALALIALLACGALLWSSLGSAHMQPKPPEYALLAESPEQTRNRRDARANAEKLTPEYMGVLAYWFVTYVMDGPMPSNHLGMLYHYYYRLTPLYSEYPIVMPIYSSTHDKRARQEIRHILNTSELPPISDVMPGKRRPPVDALKPGTFFDVPPVRALPDEDRRGPN